MTDHAIQVDGLGKRYRIGERLKRHDTLVGATLATLKRPLENLRRIRGLARFDGEEGEDVLWALRDVSFEVAPGDILGVVGRNGAGKSTLLKILSRITLPTRGRVTFRGRLASLLEVGTGFHPELTGRDNIYLNGTILGMTKREIDRKLDEIVAFSEVERFLDTPIKRYSSGMAVRLAFSVAAHLEPEILLVDEVLAVGDFAFQQKCLGRMGTVAREGRTVLFVSHNMAAVQKLCDKGILLDGGRLTAEGPIHEVIDAYLKAVASKLSVQLRDREDRSGDGRLRFTELETTSGDAPIFTCGRPARFRLRYETSAPIKNVHMSVGVYDPLGDCVLYLSNDLTNERFSVLPREGVVECRIDNLPLMPGRYNVNLYSTVDDALADWILDAAQIDVAAGDFYGTGKLPPQGFGHTLVPQRWSAADPDAEPSA